MGDAKIIYGFCLNNDDDFKKVLSAEQIAELYEESRELDDIPEPVAGEPAPEIDFPSYLATDKIVAIYDGIEANIVAECADFESEAKYGIQGESVLVGVCLNHGSAPFSGVLQLPKIRPEQRYTLDQFVLKYPQFSNFKKRRWFFYTNNE